LYKFPNLEATRSNRVGIAKDKLPYISFVYISCIKVETDGLLKHGQREDSLSGHFYLIPVFNFSVIT